MSKLDETAVMSVRLEPRETAPVRGHEHSVVVPRVRHDVVFVVDPLKQDVGEVVCTNAFLFEKVDDTPPDV